MKTVTQRAEFLEVFALISVAAPFAGFGVARVSDAHLPFILGMTVFILWMGYAALATPIAPQHH